MLALMHKVFTDDAKHAIPITRISAAEFKDWYHKHPEPVRKWMDSNFFFGKNGTACYVPNLKDGSIEELVIVLDPGASLWDYAEIVNKLRPYRYFLSKGFNVERAHKFFLAAGLGSYKFNKYKSKKEDDFLELVIRKDININEITCLVSSTHLVRDLINTPSNDMGPMELAKSVIEVAKPHTAKVNIIEGKDLISQNFPAIYTVGMGSIRQPLLIDFTWGSDNHKKITLVGKGVCFDTGGLDLKPSSGMLLMKKDMAGVAHVLGLAKAIMEANLPVRLRVLIPAVENSVSGQSYRPLDVIKMRSGKTVEVGNTDAEGRLILADALAEADQEKPDLIIDIATLTGSIRAGLGTELPGVFSNNDELVHQLIQVSHDVEDYLWHMPLWEPYRSHLKSKIADISSTSSSPDGGAITAALFLSEFLPNKSPWIHIDTMAWNVQDKPGRPQGGEAMGLRALYAFIKNYVGVSVTSAKKSQQKHSETRTKK